MTLDTLTGWDPQTDGTDSTGEPDSFVMAQRFRRPRATPAPRWWADVASAVTWLSVIAVIALWVSNAGLQELGLSATGFTAVGRLAALLSGDLLLILVLLMARIPFVERAYGQDGLARRHRTLGFLSFNLLLAHLVLTISGYAVSDRKSFLSQFWSLVSQYPGIPLAFVAFVVIVLIVVTSIRYAKKRLRYETWHLVHIYAYLSVALVLPHEIATGTEFLSTYGARIYWLTLYGIVLAATLLYRVALPMWRTWRHRLVVSQVVREAPDVVSIHLKGRALQRMGLAAGQFMNFRFLDGPDWLQAHPYSLSAAPRTDRLRITVKGLGDSFDRMSQLRPGIRVLMEGPYGRLTSAVRTRRKITLIAAGIGITPMRALLEEFDYDPSEATLIYRANTPTDLVFRSELDELARLRGARVFYLIGPRIPGRESWLPEAAARWSDSAALERLVPDIAFHDVYVCGGDAWMQAVRKAVSEAGVPDAQIHVERFDW